MDILDRILRPIRMDRASRANRHFFRDYVNRPRYHVLTRDALESFDELEFDSAVVDYVDLRIRGQSGPPLEIVSQMSPGIQAVYSTWWVGAEVDNGGFHQYFFNKGDWAAMALEGYQRLQAPKRAALMARAIEISMEEEATQASFYSGNVLELITDYHEARKASRLPELDTLFCRLSDEENMVRLSYEYMKNHIDEFIAN